MKDVCGEKRLDSSQRRHLRWVTPFPLHFSRSDLEIQFLSRKNVHRFSDDLPRKLWEKAFFSSSSLLPAFLPSVWRNFWQKRCFQFKFDDWSKLHHLFVLSNQSTSLNLLVNGISATSMCQSICSIKKTLSVINTFFFSTKTFCFRFHLKEKWALRGKDCCSPKMS